MSEQEEIVLFERIRKNIESTQQKMLIQKVKLGESVVVADENGQPCVIDAKEALCRFKIDSIERI